MSVPKSVKSSPAKRRELQFDDNPQAVNQLADKVAAQVEKEEQKALDEATSAPALEVTDTPVDVPPLTQTDTVEPAVVEADAVKPEAQPEAQPESDPELSAEVKAWLGMEQPQPVDVEAIQQPYQESLKSYNDMIATLEDNAKEQEKYNKAAEAQSYNTRVFGGITEAVASIANLVGTSHGASHQQWASPQPGWMQQASTLRRERDAKLQNYRAQLATLQQQKAAITNNMQGAVQRAQNQYSRDNANFTKLMTAAYTAEAKHAGTVNKLDANTRAKIMQTAINAAVKQSNVQMHERGVGFTQAQMEKAIETYYEQAVNALGLGTAPAAAAASRFPTPGKQQ